MASVTIELVNMMIVILERENPPSDVRVETSGQRSALTSWKPPKSESTPIGYEIFFIQADKRIVQDEDVNIRDWLVYGISIF